MSHPARYRAPGPFLDPGGISPRIFRALSPLRTEAALAAALLAGCAAAGGGARPEAAEVEALRTEVAALRAENQRLEGAVERLSAQVDALAARLARGPADPAAAAAAPLVPEGLAVVRVEPAARPPREPAREGAKARRAPPVATGVPIAEPDAEALSRLSRGRVGELSAEAAAELRAARAKDALGRAHALEDFSARYPHHPLADDALLEAADAYAASGRAGAACTLARRVAEEYPAGDRLPDALWRLAGCEPSAEAERRLLTRLVTEFPTSAAARRAGERLAVVTGRAAVASPAADPARSGP